MTLQTVPVGATIVEAYYAIPGHYTIGQRFPSFTDALDHASHYPQPVIELRWVLKYPQGGSLDTPIERIGAEQVAALLDKRTGVAQ